MVVVITEMCLFKSRWGGSLNHLQSRYQIFKFSFFFSLKISIYSFFLHLNNLQWENINRNNKNNNNSDNHNIKAHKIQDGLSQSAFVTIAEAEKRQLDSVTLGAFWTVCLHVCLSVCLSQDCEARQKDWKSQRRPFPPAVSDTHPLHQPNTPKWESQYEVKVMECILKLV